MTCGLKLWPLWWTIFPWMVKLNKASFKLLHGRYFIITTKKVTNVEAYCWMFFMLLCKFIFDVKWLGIFTLRMICVSPVIFKTIVLRLSFLETTSVCFKLRVCVGFMYLSPGKDKYQKEKKGSWSWAYRHLWTSCCESRKLKLGPLKE